MIGEIFQLQQAVNLMSNSLRSFFCFVPVGLFVSWSTAAGSNAKRESRFLTIFFSDLEISPLSPNTCRPRTDAAGIILF